MSDTNMIGSDWVSASYTRNWFLNDPLLDWLKLYGEEKGFIPDTKLPGYDPATDFTKFILSKGNQFEAGVVSLLPEVVRIAQSSKDIRNPAFVQATLDAMKSGAPIIHQGVLHHAPTKTFGSPDLLVRSDVLEDIWGIKSEGPKNHYVVIDIKYSTLHLMKSGEMGNDKIEYKAQVHIYNRALGLLTGFQPASAYLLGRAWKQGEERGDSCMDKLGVVPQNCGKKDAPLSGEVNAAIAWIRRVRTEGMNWNPLTDGARIPELRPHAKNQSDTPWHVAKKEIVKATGDLTQMWRISPAKRDTLILDGITSLLDPSLNAGVAGVGGSYGPVFDSILAANQPGAPVVSPAKLKDGAWRDTGFCDVYVDFETTNDTADDMKMLPKKNSQPRIFMVGMGWVEKGEFVTQVFTSENLTKEAEAKMISNWLDKMGAVQKAHGGVLRPFCWSQAEDSAYENAYNSAKERHRNKTWPEINWMDFLTEVVRREPVCVAGAMGFGLKAVAKALYAHGLIKTSWPDGGIGDGLGAMVAAWSADQQRDGRPMGEMDIMKDVAAYNVVDVTTMYEVVSYLRANH